MSRFELANVEPRRWIWVETVSSWFRNSAIRSHGIAQNGLRHHSMQLHWDRLKNNMRHHERRWTKLVPVRAIDADALIDIT